jgi:hypothetical protein
VWASTRADALQGPPIGSRLSFQLREPHLLRRSAEGEVFRRKLRRRRVACTTTP